MLKLLFIISITTIAGKDLPGLDYLASGFNALKMISNNEEISSSDHSKFRLFDLRERDGVKYILEIINQTQTFNTPSVVQVTTINMRNRIGVESVSYTYEEFFQK